MDKVAGFLRFRKDKSQWENPRASIGEFRGLLRNGTFTCWEAIGPAREAWKTLGPELKSYVEGSFEYGPALSLGIYMIGRDKDTAAPKILICSTDPPTRKEVRKAIKGSGIMDKYPTIGLGDISRLPDLLAQVDIEPAFVSNPIFSDVTVVLAAPSDTAFGRRLFIPKQEGKKMRPATAGPILHIDDAVYQLTVGHAFLELDDGYIPERQSLTLDDCDFDGQSITEVDHSVTNREVTDKCKQSTDALAQNGVGRISKRAGLQDSSSSALEISPSGENMIPSRLEKSPEKDTSSDNPPQAKTPKFHQRLDHVGKLALLSQAGTKPSLDYALVELEGEHRNGSNEIAFGPNISQRWLRVGQAMEVGSEDVNIVTMTSSSGFLSGKLCATASYMRRSNQRTLQELYFVRLDGHLADGDCGSGVVDYPTGAFYGHIVAGTIGTRFAYIVPAKQVFQDIEDRLGEPTLAPPQSPRQKLLEKHRLKKILQPAPELGPLHLIEFASKDYFSQVKLSTKSGKDTNSEKSANFRSMPSVSISPQDQHQRSTTLPLHRAGKRKSTRRPWILDPLNSSRFRFSTMESRAPAATTSTQPKGKEIDIVLGGGLFISRRLGGQEGSNATTCPNFEQGFFTIPSDIQAQIIASLRVSDILNLRATSRSWHNLISINEKPIARAFLNQNPIPRFLTCLYPVPSPTEVDLHYICGLRHRLLISLKLSTMIAEWITKDLFLRAGEAERLEFLPQQARMRCRLVPLLCTIFHFFEAFRHLHLEQVLEHSQSLPLKDQTLRAIESKIMDTYDNETLLQVHQIFPLVVSFLCRKLRPPSYFGRLERSFRGYHRDAPPHHIIAAIFCIGGLRNVARFSKIEGYDPRRTAVDIWYSSITSQPIDSRNEVRRFPLQLDQIQWRRGSKTATVSHRDNTLLASKNTVPRSAESDRADLERLSWRESPVFHTSLAVGPPMDLLPVEQARRLLPELPALNQIWIHTAEALLLERRAVERRQDIKKNAQVLLELIRESVTDTNMWIFEGIIDNII